MIYIALCDDGPGSTKVRADLLPIHSQHVVGVLDQLALAAPFGPVDGLSPTSTDGLTGSIFAIEAECGDDAIALMKNDPYSGPAWKDVEILAANDQRGAWARTGHAGEGGILAGDGTYLLLSTGAAANASADQDILFSANLQHIGMAAGEQTTDYRSVTFVKAQNLVAAAARGRELYGDGVRIDAMSIPVGLGGWVGMPTLSPA